MFCKPCIGWKQEHIIESGGKAYHHSHYALLLEVVTGEVTGDSGAGGGLGF